MDKKLRFYSFGSQPATRAFAASPDIFTEAVQNGDYSDRRQIHHFLAWGDYPAFLDFPVVFHQDEYAKEIRDFIDMGYNHNPFLISTKVKNLLIENSFTGWKDYPILLYDNKGNQINGYHGFSTIGRGGTMEGSLGPEWKEISRRGNRLKYDLSQWDGSDFFRVFPGYLIATERVVSVLRSHKITGFSVDLLSNRVDY